MVTRSGPPMLGRLLVRSGGTVRGELLGTDTKSRCWAATREFGVAAGFAASRQPVFDLYPPPLSLYNEAPGRNSVKNFTPHILWGDVAGTCPSAWLLLLGRQSLPRGLGSGG